MKHNGKTRLISFGCSFTCGSELIDHELLGISFDECNKIKRQWTADKKTIHKFEEYVIKQSGITTLDYVEMSSKRSYAAKLADKLGLEHVNYARPGAAVDHMVLDLFRGHYTQKINPETDLIFLGITSPHRYLNFIPESNGVPVSRVMSNMFFEDADLHYNDYKVMQTYFCALQNFKNFCITNNFDFYIQPIHEKHLMFYHNIHSKSGQGLDIGAMFRDIDDNWQYIFTFKKIFEEIMRDSLDSNLSLFYCKNDDPCGFLHPSEKSHVDFAEKLYVKITNKKN